MDKSTFVLGYGHISTHADPMSTHRAIFHEREFYVSTCLC